MQLNVTCREYREINGQSVWRPISEDEQFSRALQTADKSFFVNEERIVFLDPRTREVVIDDGTSDGTVWILGETSAKYVKELLS